MSYNNPGEVLTDIGNSIRTLYGSTSSIPFVDMPELIKGAISGEGIDLSGYNGTNWILAFADHINFDGSDMSSKFYRVDYDTTTSAHSLDLENILDLSACFSTFRECRLADVNLTGWQFNPNTTLSHTFYNCNIENLNLSNWEMSSATFSNLFWNAHINSLDFTGWDTSQVTSMSGMFGPAATITKMWVPSTFVYTGDSSHGNPFKQGNLVIYTDATDATTQGWGTIGPNVVIHYNSTYQDFINA